jgi:hypothetical protein
MQVKIKVVTLIAHEHEVIKALEAGGYAVSERSLYDPLKCISLVVVLPWLPFELNQKEFQSIVLRWLYHRLGHELFFIVMGA